MLLKWVSGVYGYYDLKFWACDEDFRSQQEKQRLSGAGRAVFERVIHREPCSGYRVLGIGYWLNY